MMLSKWKSDVNYVKNAMHVFYSISQLLQAKKCQNLLCIWSPSISSARLHIVRWEVLPLNVGLQLASVARKRLPSYRTSTIVQKCQLFGNKHLTIHKHWRDKQSDACQNLFFFAAFHLTWVGKIAKSRYTQVPNMHEYIFINQYCTWHASYI